MDNIINASTSAETITLIVCIILACVIVGVGRHRQKRIRLPKNCHIESPKGKSLIRCLRRMMTINGKRVIMDATKVEIFSFETLLVIYAQAEKGTDIGKKLFYWSDKPPLVVRKTLWQSSNHDTHHIHQTGDKTVFTTLSRITPQAVETLTKRLKRIGIRDYFLLNDLVTEILGNALEHGIRDQNINWWMHLVPIGNSLKMIFVDMGTGIASSYRAAGIGRHLSDRRLMKSAINGKIGSSTKAKNRGKGLRQINHMVRNNLISDFILITNSVTLRYKNEEYTIEKHPNFVGTYYSWTVNKDNFIRWQTSLTSQKTIVQL